MKHVLRGVGAFVAGLLVAGLLIGLIESAGVLIHPPPPGANLNDPEVLKAHAAAAPVAAMLVVLAAWGIGTFAGAWVAARLASGGKLGIALGLGLLFLVAGIANMLMIPHPIWMWAAGVAVFPIAAYLGGRLASGPRMAIT